MPLGSRLKAVEEQLVAVLVARPGLAGVQISRAHPGKDLDRETIWIERVRFGEKAKALSGGSNPRRQTVSVEVIVRVSQEGNDIPGVKDRAYALADEAEEAIRANISLNGAGDFGGVEGGEAECFVDTDGRVAAVQLDSSWVTTKSA